MYKHRQNHGDTTYTKIFVGGLAWATQSDSVRRYFENFGEISEAVVISDRRSGKSKGYGFVTFKDQDSAMQACENPYPVIDGRRTNCNLAAFGAERNPTTNLPYGLESYRASKRSTYFCDSVPEFYTCPYSGYRIVTMAPLLTLHNTMTENPSQVHVYHQLYGTNTGTRMAATSELGTESRPNSLA